ncbi:MAG TPA: DUF4124 domain-containing protein, partial [Burkholderiaceae bacterium]|nr:DUF4124 domain-containing protein [Burkholderiaceae bacterium]
MRAMPRWTIALTAALLVLALALPAAAQWKWRDKRGQTQYSDLPPPPGTPEADILQKPSANATPRRAALPASGASAAAAAPLIAARASDPELEAKRKQAEQEAENKKKAEEAKVAAQRAENCDRAKASLRTLDSGIRIARVNDKGE